jgi:hypothetical protein
MGMVKVMVQTLLQHGVEALKIARYPARGLLGAASALAHGLVSH